MVDGCGGNAIDGGLITVEGKKKPNYYALKKLLKSTWSTKWQGRLEGGRVKLRAFFGEYEASVSGYRSVKFNLYSHMPRRVVVHLTRR